MRFHGLDLNLLVVLDTLLKEHSITVAAKTLHRTQPAVSAALRRLRDYFDDDLFVMNGRKLTPTPLALTLSGPIRDALNQIQLAVIGRNNFDPSMSTRTFRIIMSDYIALTFFCKVALQAARSAPNVGFEIIQFDDNFDAPLSRGEVDFLIFPDIFLSEKHPSTFLFQEELVAVRSGYEKRPKLTMKSYLAARHVAAKFGKTRKPAIEDYMLSQLGLRRDIDIVLPNFSLLPAYIEGTDRVATMHRRLADQLAQSMPLTVEPLPLHLPPMNEMLQWPQLNDKDPASIWMRNLIIEQAKIMGGNAQVNSATMQNTA